MYRSHSDLKDNGQYVKQQIGKTADVCAHLYSYKVLEAI
jgi:hypothetical protein